MLDLVVRVAQVLLVITCWVVGPAVALLVLILAQQLTVGGESYGTQQWSSRLCAAASFYMALSAWNQLSRSLAVLRMGLASVGALLGVWFQQTLIWLLVPVAAAAGPLIYYMCKVYLNQEARDSLFVADAMLAWIVGVVLRYVLDWRRAAHGGISIWK